MLRLLLKSLARFLFLLNEHGWKVIVSFFIPVWWAQDIDGINNGADIMSLKEEKTSWFYGTYKARETCINSLNRQKETS